MASKSRYDIFQEMIVDLHSAQFSYIANIHQPMTDAFAAALRERNRNYADQASLNQLGTDIIVIIALAAVAAVAPVAVVGAGTGAWLARGYAGMRARSGLTNSRSMLKGIANTRFRKSWSHYIGYKGLNHDKGSVAGTLTYGGAKVTGDLAGYGVFMLRARALAEKANTMGKLDMEATQIELDPDYYATNFMQYIDARFKEWEFVLKGLRDDDTIPDDAAAHLASVLRNAPVFQNVARVRGPEIQPIFELIFYMYDILSGDRLERTTVKMNTMHGGTRTTTSRPITTMPSSPDYPKPQSGGGITTSFSEKITHVDPGTRVGDRINDLYKEVIGSEQKFFDNWYLVNDVNHEVMLRAEDCMGQIIEKASFTGDY